MENIAVMRCFCFRVIAGSKLGETFPLRVDVEFSLSKFLSMFLSGASFSVSGGGFRIVASAMSSHGHISFARRVRLWSAVP